MIWSNSKELLSESIYPSSKHKNLRNNDESKQATIRTHLGVPEVVVVVAGLRVPEVVVVVAGLRVPEVVVVVEFHHPVVFSVSFGGNTI
jgi:hypothetical protein